MATTSPGLNLHKLTTTDFIEIYTNENFMKLDAAFQFSVKSKGDNTPPGSPNEGDSYIIGDSPTAAWSDNANDFTFYDSDAWIFITPLEGWIFYVQDTNELLVYDGTNYDAITRVGGDGFETHRNINLDVTDENRWTASDGTPVTLDVAYSGAGLTVKGWAFDDGADEKISGGFPMPEEWDASTNIKARFYWQQNDTNTGDVVWVIEAKVFDNHDDMDIFTPTDQTATDTATGTADRLQIATTAGFTPDGTAGTTKYCIFRIGRLGLDAADTKTGDAILLGVQIQIALSEIKPVLWT